MILRLAIFVFHLPVSSFGLYGAIRSGSAPASLEIQVLRGQIIRILGDALPDARSGMCICGTIKALNTSAC